MIEKKLDTDSKTTETQCPPDESAQRAAELEREFREAAREGTLYE